VLRELDAAQAVKEAFNSRHAHHQIRSLKNVNVFKGDMDTHVSTRKWVNLLFVLNLLRSIRFFQELFVLPHKLFTVMRVIFGASRRALPLTAIAGCTLGTVGFEQLAYHLNYAVRATLISSTVLSFASLAFRNN